MVRSKRYFPLFAFVIGGIVTAVFAISAAAQTFTVINTFNKTDGVAPMSGLTFDQSGNLYGTTSQGGKTKGVVYELSPNGSSWTETVLYEFGSHSNDGAMPIGGVIFDGKGNLYGTTERGGSHSRGTVWELSPVVGGGWTETVIHNFGSIVGDGEAPIAGLSIDANGNLYGTTYYGGANKNCPYNNKTYSCGTAFELSPASGGGWTYSVIHSFSDVNDGYFPVAGLTPGPDNDLYGEASYGATYGQGLLFELIPGTGGTWTEQGLHVWGYLHDGRPDGGYPYSTVIFDSTGLMFGSTNVGGTHGDLGTVFKFTQNSGGWAESNLHGFGNSPEGSYPYSSLVDGSGDLYGTTYEGGTLGYGTVYELYPNTEGGYSYIQLYNFTGGADGALPTAGLVMDSEGNLYGTAPYGGATSTCTTGPAAGCGVVYKISF